MLKKIIFPFLFLFMLVGCDIDENDDIEDADFKVTLETKDRFGVSVNSFNQGEDIEMILSIKNTSDEDKVLTFSSSKLYDLILVDSQGDTVWQRSNGQGFASVVTTYTLKVDKSSTFIYTWDQLNNSGTQVPIGEYTLVTKDIGVNTVKKTTIQIQ